jgi:hypothetical protein
MTIGIVEVACLAASGASVPIPKITSTLSRTLLDAHPLAVWVGEPTRQALAILLWREPAGHPFPGRDPELGPPDVLMVDPLDLLAVLRHIPDDVAASIVGDLQALVEEEVHLNLPRKRVLVTKFLLRG